MLAWTSHHRKVWAVFKFVALVGALASAAFAHAVASAWWLGAFVFAMVFVVGGVVSNVVREAAKLRRAAYLGEIPW